MYIRIGTNRLVFVFRRFVVKIPILWRWRHFIHGVMANYHERDIWKCAIVSGSVIFEFRESLALVKWTALGCLLLCMERADDVAGDTLFPSFDTPFIPLDKNPCNIGLYNGRIVLRDYGPPIIDNESFDRLRAEK